jgi:hypothetical protein
MNDAAALLPSDLRPIAEKLYELVQSSTWAPLPSLRKAFQTLQNLKGDPAALNTGVHILTVDVTGQINQAKTSLDLANSSFRGAWKGRGAESFTGIGGYYNQLSAAIQAAATSATDTGQAVALFRSALLTLWRDVIKEAGTALVAATAAINTAVSAKDGKASDAASAVTGIVQSFVGFVTGIGAALIALVDNTFKASDSLTKAEAAPPGMVNVTKADNDVPSQYYNAPTGYQLVAPNENTMDPNWNDKDVRGHWQPAHGDQTALDNQAMNTMANAFRDNGRFWTAATGHSAAAELHLTAKAFGSAGGDFYKRVHQVLTRDKNLYKHTDARMDAIGNTLTMIGRSYGMVDNDAAHHINNCDYLRNE